MVSVFGQNGGADGLVTITGPALRNSGCPSCSCHRPEAFMRGDGTTLPENPSSGRLMSDSPSEWNAHQLRTCRSRPLGATCYLCSGKHMVLWIALFSCV